MKFFAINGSHRKDGNTARLLEKAAEGIKSISDDNEVESVNLYDILFNGCKSCFACKKINGRHYGKCVYKDDFKPILEKIVLSDGVILGSPVYFGDVSGVMRCFLERFIFPFFVYDEDMTSLAPKKMAVGCIYTMNLDEKTARHLGYHDLFDKNEMVLEKMFTKPFHLYAYDTYQFDYSKYKMEIFTEKEKRKTLEEQFPIDLENAFKLGEKIAIQAKQHG